MISRLVDTVVWSLTTSYFFSVADVGLICIFQDDRSSCLD